MVEKKPEEKCTNCIKIQFVDGDGARCCIDPQSVFASHTITSLKSLGYDKATSDSCRTGGFVPKPDLTP